MNTVHFNPQAADMSDHQDDDVTDTTGVRASTPAAKARRSRRIVDAVVQLAEEGGVDAVRARAICDRAGVSMGTLYRTFDSIEEILLSAFQDDFDELEHQLRSIATEGGTRQARLDRLFGFMTNRLMAREGYARAVISAMASGHHKAAELIGSINARLVEMIHGALVGRVEPLPVLGASAERSPQHMAAGILRLVWFSMLIGWANDLYSRDDVLNEMHGTANLLVQAL